MATRFALALGFHIRALGALKSLRTHPLPRGGSDCVQACFLTLEAIRLMYQSESKAEDRSNNQERGDESQRFTQRHLSINQNYQRDEQRQVTNKSGEQDEVSPPVHPTAATF